ncbi:MULTISPECIES: ABC transporter ATP-binding protein [Bacillus]|uniref:ABC transporter ATP-binding protein n=1 Tax=Bacillus thuringiensis serovar sooncheon TaxID=180891 RepID=A0A9Q5SCP5_BACTU|nr:MULTISPECIES: ABC transporter ATP-binding protein [Bacillus]MDC7971635.1 ABC transporter ATP-binding protein [Bacillus sp. BLCC-B18]OTW71238.1 ABC transporter ATP-binding protein [Bacillus thuringiensis serovar coreanensis]OTX41368.1 ABC transporter ATP-binding protein [Bacillus thuringiensis serovar sooncheon]OTX47372.1 ABC transporter ATP-binding protein [Bacillus thuringiensis serovar guiyangiensis]OTX65749.1 ABC transporter ATP-binding protein [Bacillus thuringiensis serovar roskildiens
MVSSLSFYYKNGGNIMKEYKRILLPLQKEKLLVIAAVCSGIFAAILNLSRPLFMGLIVDNLIQRELKGAYLYITLFAASRLLMWINNLSFDYVSSKASQRILLEKRIGVLRHFFLLPFEESEKIKQGELETLVMSDIPNWVRLYGSILIEYIHAIAQFVGAFIALQHIDIEFILWVTPFLFLSATVPVLMGKKVRNIASIAQKNQSSVVEMVSQFVKGVQDLRSLQKEKWAIRLFKGVTAQSYKTEVKKTMMQHCIGVVGTVIETGAYIVVLIIGTQKIMQGKMEVGSLVAVLATIEMLFFPVRYVGDLLMMTQVAIASANRVSSFLDKRVANSNLERAMGMTVTNVSFQEKGEEKCRIENIDLQIHPGELVIVVGESGAGKTTLLKLMTGLYKPSNGSIVYHGNKARMTTVWQEPRFFRTTVKENTYFGEVYVENQLEKNMELVNVKPIIRDLPEGIQTVLHKSGEEFSGGERKRLALLRAIGSNPNLIMLDEPTAGLDPSNQETVWNMIEGLGRDVTRIVATHDVERAMIADWIVVMNNGIIVECGDPRELLTYKSFFKKMLIKR